HGGAWVIGSGIETTYDGTALARRGDAVIVTLNYRLGPVGFLRGRGLAAWVSAAGIEPPSAGPALARRGDAVIVTLNYRLGPFGFLRGRELGGGLDSTGNEGMLDVLAALEWVRDEIASFGGDPHNVTVFGESAGSVNIACLLTMPRARGLFHKAVLESGSLNLTRPPKAALESTRQILTELGIAPDKAHALRDLPARDLVAAQNDVAGRRAGPA